ncbi:MAG: hypothetical protein WBW16_05655 [Bacteroidota bacterium]
MKRHIAILSTTLLLIGFSHSAYSGNGSSGYSRYGIGDIRFFAGGRSAGMGGTAIALLSSNSLNRINPAGQTKLTLTHFTGTFSYEGFQTTDGIQSAYLSSGNFGGAFLALPLSPDNGVAFTAGFNPYSSVNYKVQGEQTIGSDNYTQLYFGEGGLSTALAGLTLAPIDSLSLGLQANYLFGQIRSESDVTFSSTDFVSAKYQRTVNINGFDVTIGFIYTGLGRLTGLKSLEGFNVGAILSTATNLNATQDNINIVSVGQDTLTGRGGKIHIPVSRGIGFSWLVGGKYLVAGDYLHQQWGDFEYFGEHPQQIRNSTRLSLGMEIEPSQERGTSYWNRVAYRVGTYYLASYYQIGTESINEFGITSGLGMPIGADTRLDFALEYGRRGTIDQHLLQDNIFRFSITLSLGEKWFVRTEEE